MKQMVAIMLAVILVLGLAGCGQEAKLYEKYESIINDLEAKNYVGAMGQIAQLAAAEQTESQGAQPEALTLLCNEWHLLESDDSQWNINSPKSLVIRKDGTCTVDGSEMTWILYSEEPSFIEVLINHNGENKYFARLHTQRDIGKELFVVLSEVMQQDDYLFSGDMMAHYMRNPMTDILLREWYLLDGEGELPDYFFFNVYEAVYAERWFDWIVVSDIDNSGLTVSVTGKNGRTDSYTVVMEERDGIPILQITDNVTGAKGLYCSHDFGYDENWPEYLYPIALENLERYLNNAYIWADDQSYHDNSALEWLYNAFMQMGDYRDSAEYLSRFTVHENMHTKTMLRRVTNLGEKDDRIRDYFSYDQQGALISGQSDELFRMFGVSDSYTMYISYEDGRISEVQVGETEAIVTPEYNENGQMVCAVTRFNTETKENVYEYNGAGQLISAVVIGEYRNEYHYTYRYDEMGRLSQVVLKFKNGYDYTWTTEYIYDEQGYLIEKYYTEVTHGYPGDEIRTIERTVYTNDDQGRPLKAQVFDEDDNVYYSEILLEYIYEDLYFYDPEN